MVRNKYNNLIEEDGVFSGSGTAIYLHIGAWLIISRYVRFKKIEGISGGSIIAALISVGYLAHEIETIAKELSLSTISDYSVNFFNRFGLLKGNKFHQIMKKYLGDITFAEAYEKHKIHLDIVATNLLTGQKEYFNHINTPTVKLHDAVRASMSIPFLFKYHVINGIPYFDGGMVSNFDIDHFKDNNVIGFRILTEQQGLNVIKLSKLTITSFKDIWKIFNVKGMLGALTEYLMFCVNTLIVSIEQKHIEDAPYAKIITLKNKFNPLSFNHSKENINQMIQTGKETASLWVKENVS